MSDVLQPEISCKTAKEFLEMILPSGDHFGNRIENPTWLFRGQGRDYELKPSLFRNDKKSLEKIESLIGKTPPYSYEKLLVTERDLIDSFFYIADKRGFLIPDDSQELRSDLADFRRNDLEVINRNGEWLSSGRLLSLVALAQHYGIPTRLLDWSLQPLVAAYFAAEGGVRRFDKNNKAFLEPEEPIVFWSFYFPTFGLNLHRTKQYSLKGVTAPGSGNPNLKAQQGVFTVALNWYTEEKDKDYLPLYKVVENINASGYSKDVDGCQLQKITLPVTETFSLLRLLSRLDISPSSVYPSYQSISADIQMKIDWEIYG